MLESCRVLLYHKQATSARTLFLRHGHGSVIAPDALPALSSVLDEDETQDAALLPHPAALLNALGTRLDLEPSLLKLDTEFHATVDTPPGPVAVYLAHFTTMDPPRALLSERGGHFLAITELRGGHPAEMELLRRAYSAILGG